MKYKKFDSINVIPFIDVLLVLLAIVLMTSTFIAKGVIDISLPKASTALTQKSVQAVNIIIKADNSLLLEKEKINIQTLKNKAALMNTQKKVFIHGDKSASFKTFVEVLDILKQYNIENISIVTKK